MNKKLWLRVGMTINLTNEEVDLIFSQDPKGIDIVRNAIEEGRYYLDGESYIPESYVEDFNKAYGTDYACENYEWYVENDEFRWRIEL